MGRKKRSEILTEKRGEILTEVTIKEKPEVRLAPPVVKPTKEYRQAICPVCGRSAGLKRVEYPAKGYYSPPATENFWQYTKDFDPNKPFGVIQEVGGGKGHSFRVIGYFNPEDDVDGFFPLVKARLLKAVREWRDKGWITEQELIDLLRSEGA